MVNGHAGFAWYELLTTDMAAAGTFYANVLGWKTRDAGTSRFNYGVFTVSGSPVCGLMDLPAEGRKLGATPRWVGYVAVDDLDAAVDRLKQLGGAVYVPPTQTNIGRIAIVADPQRATLALGQDLKHRPPPVQPNEAGRVGWHELLAADWKNAFVFYRELFGWQGAEPGAGADESYQAFSVGGQVVGGMFDKLPIVPVPFWLYYFNVPDISSAGGRVTACGGRVIQGPIELREVGWVAWCVDPQGAIFALQAVANKDGVEQLNSAELGWSAEWSGFASRGRLVAKGERSSKPRN
jgi:predicted enzyme related to lactoylglutathione lyase